MKIRVAWDRPARPPSGPSEHVLLIGVGTDEHIPRLTGNFCLVLDSSSSMNSVERGRSKLDNAKDACRAVIRCLNPDDLLSLVTYSTRPTPHFEARRRADLSDNLVDGTLEKISARGVTCTDLALAEAERVLSKHRGVDRLTSILLVTDGHPTDGNGKVLDATARQVYLETARRLAAAGLNLVLIGLGDARHFNGPFLIQVADAGQGKFCYAPDPARLATVLEQTVETAQAVVATRLQFELVPRLSGVKVLDFCRIAPDHQSLDISGTGPWTVSCGNIAAMEPTEEAVYLARIQTPGQFGMETGPVDVLHIQPAWQNKNGSRVSGPEIRATMNYSTNYADYQIVNAQVEQLRIRWEMNRCQNDLLRADGSSRTKTLLAFIADRAEAIGCESLSHEVKEQIDELRTSGRLNPDRALRIEQDLRTTGLQAARTVANPVPAFPVEGGFGGIAPTPVTKSKPASTPLHKMDDDDAEVGGFGVITPRAAATPAVGIAAQRVSLSMDSAVLTLIEGRQPGQTYRLNKLRMVVGQIDSPEFPIDIDLGSQQFEDAPAVSRRHAEFTWQEGRLWLADLGSRNGTFINHERLPPLIADPLKHRREVSPNDIVLFGNLKFRIETV